MLALKVFERWICASDKPFFFWKKRTLPCRADVMQNLAQLELSGCRNGLLGSPARFRIMAPAAFFMVLTLVSVWGMPRSRSRSPLYSPTTDICLDCPGSGSSRSEATSRRSRTSRCVSSSGLYHTSDARPSIFTSSERAWEQEPDATATSQQLQAALAEPPTESHRDFVEVLMGQVFSYNISPPLQRTLLLLYIQDHRERLQPRHGQGRISLTIASSGQNCAHVASCCSQVSSVLENQAMSDAIFRQEMVRKRTRMWHTATWQDTLAKDLDNEAQDVRGDFAVSLAECLQNYCSCSSIGCSPGIPCFMSVVAVLSPVRHVHSSA